MSNTVETRYNLRTVEDFLDVPVEKLPACLVDFLSWIDIMRELRNANFLAENVKPIPDQFQWVDDGKHDVGITIRLKEPPVVADVP